MSPQFLSSFQCHLFHSRHKRTLVSMCVISFSELHRASIYLTKVGPGKQER